MKPFIVYTLLERITRVWVGKPTLLDKISFCYKLEIVRKIYNMPAQIYNRIMKLNSIRNDLAHNYNPEERKKTIINVMKKTFFVRICNKNWLRKKRLKEIRKERV